MPRAPLLGSAALALAALLGAAPARAQIPVTDAGANMQLVQQVAYALQTVRQLEAQYQQLRSTYEAIAHTNSVTGLAGQLGGLTNTLPGAGQVQGLMGGNASIGGLASTLMGQNRVYAPQGTDWAAQEMQRRAQATANVQAIALQQMQATEGRIAGLQQLEAEIDRQPDLQAVNALNGRIASEQTFLAAQQQQLLQLQVLQRAQDQVDAQRAEERQRQSAEQWRDSLPALGDN
ncbi:type IV secretion system protein [Roseicella sp. DB1501]|uniref:type IV secretion system protein n=1 Tax=Roseicella sp. DB1501 TaxID=2730925 RepID=UPI0014930C2B|nr:type IV secretion system protein [Roseicella sp. DB1501]NOG73912.1 hypothetical protein [Roseicella sp. DB1501]